MKRISHSANARDKVLHVEADGCIVNIQVGLADMEGRKVTAVTIIADHGSSRCLPPMEANWGSGRPHSG